MVDTNTGISRATPKPEHDASYKSFFSHKAMVEPLLRRIVAQEWMKDLDFSSLEPVKTHFVGPQNRKRDSDLIWRLKLRSRDEWLYVYLLLEFQSTPDDFMALRMLTYTCLLYEDLVKRKLTPGAGLPPVLPILLYNGKTPWSKADQIADLVDSPEGLKPYVPRFRYHLIDEGRLPEDLLEPTDDPVAALFKLERAETSEDLFEGLKSVLETTRARNLRSLREDLIKWLHRNVLPIRFAGQDVPEVRNLLEAPQMLAETIKTWPEKWLKEGREQGRAEGKAEGRAEGKAEGRAEGKAEGRAEGKAEAAAEERQSSIFEVCSARGLELSESQRRRISDTRDLDQLRDWLIKAVAADSVDDIFT